MKKLNMHILILLASFILSLKSYAGCDVVIMNVFTGQVLKNEKIELGIKLKQNELDAIENYFNGVTPAINPYNPSATDVYGNPNDDYIDIVAHFTSPSNEHIDINGFYYKAYIEDFTKPIDSWHVFSTYYPFRVRFSPNEVGEWNVVIEIKNNLSTRSLHIDPACSNLGFGYDFDCIDNLNNPGPLQIGKHKNYLVTKDNQKSFFAIGENGIHQFAGYGFGDYLFAQEFKDQFLSNPDKSRNDYYDIYNYGIQYHYQQFGLEKLALAGGNTSRLFMEPWAFGPQSSTPSGITPPGVSTGNLLNFDDRQPHMFELDKTFSLCHQLNLHMIIALFTNANLGSGDPAWLPNWSNNPYNSNNQNLILGIDKQIKFFHDPLCRDYIKRQLRYFIARWGYDSHIFSYEILNEIDWVMNNGNAWTTGATQVKYEDDQDLRAEIYSWQSEMAAYLKQIDNNHHHLVTANYAGLPILPDNTLNDPNIDYVTLHYYDQSYDVERLGTPWIMDLNEKVLTSPKPIFNDESGSFDWENTEAKTDVTFHSMIWANAFEGYLGSPLSFYWDPAMKLGYVSQLQTLADFMKDVDFEENNFVPLSHDVYWFPRLSERTGSNCEGRLEFHALHNTIKTKAMGWVHNRTYYWGNLETCLGCDDIGIRVCDPGCSPCQLGSCNYHVHGEADQEPTAPCFTGEIEVVNDQADPKETITIPDMVPYEAYVVDWFISAGVNASGTTIFQSANVIANDHGELTLTPPRMDGDIPDYAFKISQLCINSSALPRDPVINNQCDHLVDPNGCPVGSKRICAHDGGTIRVLSANDVIHYYISVTPPWMLSVGTQTGSSLTIVPSQINLVRIYLPYLPPPDWHNTYHNIHGGTYSVQAENCLGNSNCVNYHFDRELDWWCNCPDWQCVCPPMWDAHHTPDHPCGDLLRMAKATDGFNDLIVYPNPSQGFWTIEMPEGSKEIVITDIAGRIIENKFTSESQLDIDMSESPPGIYCVNVKTNGETFNSKIIIQK